MSKIKRSAKYQYAFNLIRGGGAYPCEFEVMTLRFQAPTKTKSGKDSYKELSATLTLDQVLRLQWDIEQALKNYEKSVNEWRLKFRGSNQ